MSLPRHSRYVLDASVVLKWYLRDEPHVRQSRSLLTAFSEGRIGLVAPQHVQYEVSNALRTAVNRGRISEDDGWGALSSFFDLDVPMVSGARSITQAWELARNYQCSFYDGLYVALAEMTGFPLVHADRKLRNSLGGRFPHELWIEQFQVDNPGPA